MVVAVAAVHHSPVADRSLGCIDCNFVAHIAGMLHRTVAVDCSIAHIAVVDRSLRAVGIVAPAEKIGLPAGKCSHSE